MLFTFTAVLTNTYKLTKSIFIFLQNSYAVEFTSNIFFILENMLTYEKVLFLLSNNVYIL